MSAIPYGSTVRSIAQDIAYRINDTNFTSDPGLTNNLLPLLNEMIHHIDMVIYWERVNLYRVSFTLPFTASQTSAIMPADFIGLSEQPWIQGHIHPLNVIPDRRTALLNQNENERPVYYELADSTIWLYPPPSIAVTLEGFYFRFTNKLTTAGATMPYGSIFDQVIKEYLVKIFHTSNTTRDETGKFIIAVDPAMTKEFQQQVKKLLVRRPGFATRTVRLRKWV
jgi:hypothetical protein